MVNAVNYLHENIKIKNNIMTNLIISFFNYFTEIKGLLITIILGLSGRAVNPTMEATETAPLQQLLWLFGIIVATITIVKFFQNQWANKDKGLPSIFNLFKKHKK